jgi:hypothetical protein
MADSSDSRDDDLCLTEIDSQRERSEKRTIAGQSGTALYRLKYHKDEANAVCGKSTEVGRISNSDRMDLEGIEEDQYTLYAIFRLKDRSTVTVIQSTSGEIFKILSLGRGTVKIVCRVTITEVD